MNQKITLGERLRYMFDKSMAAGPIALIGWLALISLIIIALAGLILAVTGIAPPDSEPMGFVEGSWASLMRTLDAGTMGGDAGWGFRGIMLLVTLAGIFVVSALIGVLSSGLESKLDELRKGRSRVLESGHTIIYNWSPSIFDIISELAIANASERRPRVVIMADRDKVEMEDEIAAKLTNLGKLKVICRSGDPTDLYDLALVSPQASKSIIVLSPGVDDPDSAVVKTILALIHDPQRRAEPYRIAAEIRNARNAEMARVVGGKEVQLVLADELLSRIVVHSSRQSGLSAVYSELLDFDGSEIYVTAQPNLVGRTFGEAMLAYPACTLIGLANADGKVKLNPPSDRVITAADRAILIAEDDTTIRATEPPAGTVDEGVLRTGAPRPKSPERSLILGWNHRGGMIARELSRYVASGSLLTIAAEAEGLDAEVSALNIVGDAMAVNYAPCDSSDRSVLAGLDIPSYDHVMVLSYSDTMAAQAADTRTLVTLLHLRQIAEAAGKRISVVSEMADVRNRELAEVTRADDFVVSNKLISLMLAQSSENEYLSAIFEDLLDESGSEISMRPVEDYVALGKPVNFYTVVEAASRRGEVAFGYARRRAPDAPPDPRNMGGVLVNPAKNEAVDWQPGDRIIVLAED